MANTLTRDQYQLHANDTTAWQIVNDIPNAQNKRMAQTFTPSVTGNLNKVYIMVKKAGVGTIGDLIVSIRTTSGGQPTATVLATETIAEASVPTTDHTFLTVTFSSPPSLTSGTQYAIHCHTTGGSVFNPAYVWVVSQSGSVYTGGDFNRTIDGGTSWFTDTGKDCVFVTEMSTPVASPGLDRFIAGSQPGSQHDRVETTGAEWRSQTFTPSVSGNLSQVYVQINRANGQTGDFVTFEIQGVDVNNKPTGVALSSVESIADASIASVSTTNGLLVTFTNKPVIVAGTMYALVIKFLNVVDNSREYRVDHSSTTDQYSGGQHWISVDGGTNWNANASAQDIAFATFVQEPDTSITGLRKDQYSLNSSQTDLATNVTISGPSLDDELYAQLFTPSVTGNLKKVYLPVRRLGNTSTGDLVVEIFAVSAGIPTGSALASASITAASIPDTNIEWYIKEFEFSTPPALTASTQYAIRARALTNGNYRWASGASGTLYAGGQAMYSLDGGANWTQQSTEDLAFMTEMDVTIAQPGVDQFGFGLTVGGGNDTIDSSTEYRAQMFIPTISEKLKSVKLGLRRNTAFTGGNVTIEIQETTAGLPNGSVLATTTVADASITTTSGVITEFSFLSAPTLVAGTTYAIVLKFPNAGPNVYTLMHMDDGQGASSGQAALSTNSGGTWVAESGPNDLLFATIMFAPTVTTQTINSDAIVQITTEQTILSDAFHGAISSQTIPSDATIFITSEQTILSDAFHGAITTQTIFSDASIGVTQSVDIFSDAFVGQETNQTIFSDATIFITSEDTILSDAIVFITSLQTILSNANIFASVVQTINANASVAMTTTQTITSTAVITVREPVLKLFVVT